MAFETVNTFQHVLFVFFFLIFQIQRFLAEVVLLKMVMQNEQQRSPFFWLFPILFLFCSYDHRPKTGIQCLVLTNSLGSLFWGGFLIRSCEPEFFPCAVFLWLPILLSFFWISFSTIFFHMFFCESVFRCD